MFRRRGLFTFISIGQYTSFQYNHSQWNEGACLSRRRRPSQYGGQVSVQFRSVVLYMTMIFRFEDYR